MQRHQQNSETQPVPEVPSRLVLRSQPLDLSMTLSVRFAIVCCTVVFLLLPFCLKATTASATVIVAFQTGSGKNAEPSPEPTATEQSGESARAADGGFVLPAVGSNEKWGETYRAEDRFPPPPRQLARALSRGYEAFAAGEMLEAVGWLQQVIERPTKEDFLLRGPMGNGSVVSMNWATHCLFCALPAKERELFRIRHQATAERELAAAVADRDTNAIAEVMRRYLYTDSGIEAGLLLGYEHFQQGRPGLASSIFRRLRMIPEAKKKYDPNLSVLLALCCVLSEQEAQAEQILGEVESFADVRLPVADGRVQPLTGADEALEWLQEVANKTGFAMKDSEDQWLVSGGAWSRWKPSGTGFPLKRCRWQVPRVNDVQLEKAIAEAVDGMQAGDSILSFASDPLVVGQTVILRSYETVMGIDLSSGRRIWYYPAIDDISGFGSPLMDVGASDVRTEAIQLWLNRQAGADDLASDGARVFLVEHDTTESTLSSGVWINGNRSMVSGSNHLTALNVTKQGSLEWMVGGAASSEPALEKAYFLGPPLPVRQHVYCLVFLDNLVQLVQLDASSGQLIWQQALASVDSVVRLDEGSQQCLSPCYANGILVCPTGLGVAVGIDLATQELAWGVTYPQRTAISRYSRSQPTSRWLGPAVQIVGKYAILSPQESDHLFCVDLVSGSQAWSKPETINGRRRIRTANNASPDEKMLGLDRGEYQLVTGGDGDTILNLARTKIRSVSLSEGRVLWETSLPEGQQVNGPGFFNLGKLWVPTASGSILQYNLVTGELEDQLKMPWPIQSMICTGREIIATSLKDVGAFYQGKVVEAMFDRLADEEPIWDQQGDLADSLLDQIPLKLIVFRSQLLRHQKKWRPAIAMLDYVCRKDWTQYREQLLTTVVLEALRDDVQIGEELFDKYERFLTVKDPVSVYQFQTEGFLRAGKFREAAEVLLKLSKLPATTAVTVSGVEDDNQEARWSWPQWAAIKFRDVQSGYYKVGQTQQLLDRLAGDAQSDLSSGNIDALLRRCEVLNRLGVTKEQQLELAHKLFIEKRLTEAQWVLTPLLSTPSNSEVQSEHSLAVSARMLSARMMWSSGFTYAAMRQMQSAIAIADANPNVVPQVQQAREWLQDWQQQSPENAIALKKISGEQKTSQIRSTKDNKISSSTNSTMWREGWWNTASTAELHLDVSAVNPVGTWCTFRSGQLDANWGLRFPLRWCPHENRVEATDAWGRPMSNWIFDTMADRRRDPMANHLRYDWGTMSVLQFGEELVAVDALQLQNSSQPAELWIRDLAQRQFQILPEPELGPVQLAVHFDDKYQLYRRGNQLYGAISNLSEEGFLLDTGNRVCFISTLSGELKWQRPLSSSALSIVQNESEFCLYCEDGTVVRLAKLTGEILSQTETEIDKDDQTILCGRYVVCQSKRGQFQLRVWDLITNQWAWQLDESEVPAGKVEVAVDEANGVVCWASEKGKLRIASVATGNLLVEATVPEQPIMGIEFQARADCWLVVLKRAQLSNWQRSTGKIQCSPMPESEELLDGALFCFDRSAENLTTQMRWPHPVETKNCCLIDQSELSMPFAMFTCRSSFVERSRALAKQQDLTYMALLDLRNGRIVFEEVLPPTYQASYQADFLERGLDVRFGSMKGRVQWNRVTDQPPVPVSHLDVSKSSRLQAEIAGIKSDDDSTR